jgi:hypothetical protein
VLPRWAPFENANSCCEAAGDDWSDPDTTLPQPFPFVNAVIDDILGDEGPVDTRNSTNINRE